MNFRSGKRNSADADSDAGCAKGQATLTPSLWKYFSTGSRNVFSKTDIFTSTLNSNRLSTIAQRRDIKLNPFKLKILRSRGLQFQNREGLIARQSRQYTVFHFSRFHIVDRRKGTLFNNVSNKSRVFRSKVPRAPQYRCTAIQHT